MVTRDELLSDKAGLEEQRDALLAQINSVLGALNYINNKLKETEEEGKAE
jgi:hypothetical protein